MAGILLMPFLIYLTSCGRKKTETINALSYPQTRKVDTVDTYFGIKISDPYRWLENDTADDTKAWVKQENKITFDYLSTIPFRSKIRSRLSEIWNFEKMSAPYKKGKRYFYTSNNGTQNQSVLYTKSALDGPEKLVIDPNTFSADGTTSLSNTSSSKDGQYMAYSLSSGGSDWNTFYVMDIETGQKLSDELKWSKFTGAAWQGNGFYYGRYNEPGANELSAQNDNQKLYYHKVGDPQNKDQLIYEDKANPSRMFSPEVTDEEDWLIIYTSQSTSGNGLLIRDLKKPNSEFRTIAELTGNNNPDNYVIDIKGSTIILLTNDGAPRFKLVAVDLNNPTKANWKDIIPQSDHLLEGVSLANGKYIAQHLVEVRQRLTIYDSTGREERVIPIPDMSDITELSSDRKDSLVFFSVSQFTAPQSIYKYNILTNTTTLYNRPNIKFDSEGYITKQVKFKSKDGTLVPMFITHKKGVQLDGTNPCFLFGYGGFSSHYGPEFRIDRAVFLENGGVYAVAGIRGGNEYGEEWHAAGIKCKKQNVFDDFIAAAEYLIQEKYTSSEKLAVQGRSNGGLLIGAVLTQRPDLFKVCIPMVGVLDMLRYHKFTIGRFWASDYGLSENEDEFKCLLAYSPLHNIKPVSYPATLITTGDHDDRVVPAHSFKFAATLQENQKGAAPVLIRIDVNAGHGAGKPTEKQIDEAADIWAFIFQNLGMKMGK
jgi:prolyl oligopeptidase